MNGILKRRRFRRLVIRVFVPLSLGLLAFEIAVRMTGLPEGIGVSTPSLMIFDRNGIPLAEIGDKTSRSCQPVPLESVSPFLIDATLSAEDRRFHSHSGVDFRAAAGALFRNVISGETISGASTITQQLVKLSSGNTSRGLMRKCYENLAALKLERKWSKREILEAYLNRIEYGNRLRGIEAASRAYFGKTAGELDLAEAAFLAGLPQAPGRFNPWPDQTAADGRFRKVASFLRRDGKQAPDQPPVVLPRKRFPDHAPHFTRRIASTYQGRRSGIRTTLDLKLQNRIERISRQHGARLAPARVNQIAILVMDHRTGAIRAWSGSSDWQGRGGQIDGVSLPRSSGSTLKPFLYLRAIDTRLLTAASLVPDTPDAIRAEYLDYDPRNYDQRFRGPVRVREALANSLNVPAVYVLAKLGARDFQRYLNRSGLRLERDLDRYGAGIILGNGEVRMLDLAAAFGAFANEGLYATPRFSESEPVRHLAISSPEAATVLASILSDNAARTKTFGPGSPLAFDDVFIPCKTGTSSGFHDAWTVGATARHVVAVWVGNFDGQPMDEVVSATGPAPIWREIVDLLLPGDGGVELKPEDKELERIEICGISGLRRGAISQDRLEEWFIGGTAPVENSDSFFAGGKPLLPPEYALWCRSAHNYLEAKVGDDLDLRVVNPLDGAIFLIDPDVPRDRQEISLLSVGGQRGTIRWEVNGRSVEPVESGYFWQLESGKHEAKVVSGNQTAKVSFIVR